MADRAELVLPALGYQERLERYYADHPDFVQPDFRRNEMLGFIRGGLEDFSISRERTPGDWGIPFPIAENGETRAARGRHVGPGGRQDLRLVRRPHQLRDRRRVPRRHGGLRALVAGRPPRHRQGHRAVPYDLLARDAVERRPGGAPPRVGPRLAAGGGRRADEQEPRQLPRSERLRRRVRLRRRPLRRPARGAVRPRRGGELGLVRPPLQRRPGERLRQPRQPHGLDDQPLPRRRATGADAGAGRGDGDRAELGPRDALAPGRAAATASGSRAASCTTRRRSSGSSSARRTSSSTPRSHGSWRRPGRRATRRPGSACAACWAT